MAKAEMKMPEDFLLKISKLGSNFDSVADTVLQAGGEDLVLKGLGDLVTVGRCAAGTAAHHDMASVHVYLLPLPQRAPMVYSATGLPPMMCSDTTRATLSGVILT